MRLPRCNFQWFISWNFTLGQRCEGIGRSVQSEWFLTLEITDGVHPSHAHRHCSCFEIYILCYNLSSNNIHSNSLCVTSTDLIRLICPHCIAQKKHRDWAERRMSSAYFSQLSASLTSGARSSLRTGSDRPPMSELHV